MSNPEKLYDADYCKKVDAKEWRFEYTPSAVSILNDHFKPQSVVDIGCANGLHLKAFKQLGVKDLLGIEGTYAWAPYIEDHFGTYYIIHNLERKLLVYKKFDLAISFEVLEHIKEKFSGRVVANICRLSDTICCSANPTTKGFKHVNPQPKKYWIEKFKLNQFKYCKDEVKELQSKFAKIECSDWFKTGLRVFRRIS